MNKAAITAKRFKVEIDPPTRRKIERIAARTKLKHIHVVGKAIDAYLEREQQAERQTTQNAAA